MTSKTHILNYSPFGVLLQNRNFTSERYRYGFQGQERDDEIAGNGNSYTAEFWQYDPRLGRRWNVDPKFRNYPHLSPYACFNNNPILYADLKGLEGEPKTDVVKKGEGAWSVAQRNNITTDQLVKWNPDIFPEGLKSGTYMLHPGQQLNVSDPNLANEATTNSNIVDQNPLGNDQAQVNSSISTINGVLSISVSAIEAMGGLDKASKILESGKFQMVYNGQTKTWKLNFNGNQYVDVEVVQGGKDAFRAKASQGIKVLKVVKTAGVAFSIIGVMVSGYDIYQTVQSGEEVSGKQAADAAMAVYAFVPGYGWIISGVYFLADTTIGIDNLMYWFNASMKGWEENAKDPNGDGFYLTKKHWVIEDEYV
jgi:RHS repeat-associated protein